MISGNYREFCPVTSYAGGDDGEYGEKMRLFNVMACSIEAFQTIEGTVLGGKRSEISFQIRQRTLCLI
jgi:hypothetical protein